MGGNPKINLSRKSVFCLKAANSRTASVSEKYQQEIVEHKKIITSEGKLRKERVSHQFET